MQTRTVVALAVLTAGVALGLVSYFFLAAPLGRPTDESFSNPRVPFAAALFIGGIVLVFASAVCYELIGVRREDGA
ncbi:MAG TPA: hypothetical protein VI789_01960 [Dehalococcoidia bacterium]|nr:hypothetical protein [Dehalococcoidia bacterium]